MQKNVTLERGRIVADLVIFIIQHAAWDILKTSLYTSSADSILVISGIWIGEAEGRPMTAAKLAQFIGMPRGTVARKVKALERRGCIAEVGRGKLVMRLDHPGLKNIVDANIALNAKHIHNASRRLSKLDS